MNLVKSDGNSTFLLSIDIVPSTKSCPKFNYLSAFVCLLHVICSQNMHFFGFSFENSHFANTGP